MRVFALTRSSSSRVYVPTDTTSPLGLATAEVLRSHVWLEATEQDRAGDVQTGKADGRRAQVTSAGPSQLPDSIFSYLSPDKRQHWCIPLGMASLLK